MSDYQMVNLGKSVSRLELAKQKFRSEKKLRHNGFIKVWILVLPRRSINEDLRREMVLLQYWEPH